MAVELVGLNGGNTNNVYFPFCNSAGDLGAAIKHRNFDRAGDAAAKLLTELKPYRDGNVELRALHDLDIQDKHHTLIPTAQLATTSQVTVDMSSGKPVIKLVEGSLPDVRYCFPADSAFEGSELIPTLNGLLKSTDEVLAMFESVGKQSSAEPALNHTAP